MKNKQDKKVYIKFGMLMFVCLALGIISGYMSAVYSAGLEDVAAFIIEKTVNFSPLLLILCTLFLIPACVYCLQGKTLAEKVKNTDDDQIYTAANTKLEKAISCVTYMTVTTFTAFAIMLSRLYNAELFIDFKYRLVAIAVFLLSLFAGIFIQNAAVKQVQRINPEKKGNVLDTKFQQQWLESCDEAEQMQIGKAAYKSYVATNKAIIAVFVFICALGSVYSIGPVPALVMGFIWIVQYTSYAKAASEENNNKK